METGRTQVVSTFFIAYLSVVLIFRLCVFKIIKIIQNSIEKISFFII
jgi:hypothetical protein